MSVLRKLALEKHPAHVRQAQHEEAPHEGRGVLLVLRHQERPGGVDHARGRRDEERPAGRAPEILHLRATTRAADSGVGVISYAQIGVGKEPA